MRITFPILLVASHFLSSVTFAQEPGRPTPRGLQESEKSSSRASVESDKPTPHLALELQTDDWKGLDEFIKETDRQDKIDGYSYLISGTLASVGGLIGYYSSTDTFAKAVYSISQTIGVAAIGFGGYKLFVGNENRVFYKTLRASNLSAADRDLLLFNYRLQKGAEEARIRKVKALTHGSIALLNIYNAMREPHEDLKTALYFVGAVNFFASISFTF